MLRKDATIMIVDDMKMIRTALRKYLASLGYTRFVEAENGLDAINKHTENQVDFIFMDIVMPVMRGDEALQKLRDMDPFVPIAVLTSVADQPILKLCERTEAVGYLLKPITAQDGPKRLEKVLDMVF